MQKDLIWADDQMAKKLSAPQKKAQKDLWEITGCAQIQEIERPVNHTVGNRPTVWFTCLSIEQKWKGGELGA
jgi:hypothetical protein